MSWVRRHGLVVLIGAVVAKGIFLSVFIPLWEIPDEPAHVQYVLNIADQRKFPLYHRNDFSMAPAIMRSVEQTGYFTRRTEINKENGQKYVALFNKFLAEQPANVNPAAMYGPGYYLWLAGPSTFTRTFDLATRVVVMRMWSSVLGAVVVWLTYLIARRLRAHQGFALTAATLVAFQPMASFMFAGVNTETLSVLLSAWLVYLLVDGYGRVWRTRMVLVVGLVLGLDIFTHPSAVAFLPIVVMWYLQSTRLPGQRFSWKQIFLLLGLTFVLGYWWQMYQFVRILPYTFTSPAVEPGGAAPTAWAIVWAYLTSRLPIVFRSFWGIFGWLDIPLSPTVYNISAAACLTALIGWLVAIFHPRQRYDLPPGLLRLLMLSWVSLETLYLGLYVKTIIKTNIWFFPVQGRYYFILLPIFSVLFILGLEKIILAKHRPGLYLALSIGMVALFTYSLDPLWRMYRPG